MSAIPTKHIDGDVAVSRNASFGGNAAVRGKMTVGHDLKIEGWLDAPNIKGPNKGLFSTESDLKELYPKPSPGWYALVGDTLPATIWVVNNRKWTPTDKTWGEPNLSLTSMEAEIDSAQEKIESLLQLSSQLEKAVGDVYISRVSATKGIKELYISGDITSDMLPITALFFNNRGTPLKGFELTLGSSGKTVYSDQLVSGYNKVSGNGITIETIVDFTDIPEWGDERAEVLPQAYDINYSPTIKLLAELGVLKKSLDGLYSDVDYASKSLKAILTDQTGKNLFDKDAIIYGYWIGSEDGTLNVDATSAVSPLIPVTPGKTYFISRPQLPGEEALSTNEVRFTDSEGNSLKPLSPDGTEWATHHAQNDNIAVKAPESASYLQFTVGFVGTKCDYEKVQVEAGNEASGFEPYVKSIIVDYEHLPDDIRNMAKGYEQIKTALEELTARVSDVNETFGTIVTTEYSKNLFDKSAILEGFWIGSEDGSLNADATSAVSAPIPVIPGETYFISRPPLTGQQALITREVRFIDGDGNALKPMSAEGTEWASYYCPGDDIAVKAPDNASYLQFTIGFVGSKCDYDKVQVEVGTAHTGYEPFGKRNIIGYGNLPSDLSGIPKKVEMLMSAPQSHTITIANSDKIGFFSNSFLQGYCMHGKHAINNLSMYSDYIMYNYGHSGDDMLELLARINRNETWLGAVPVQDWGIRYGVIAMQDNDGALYAASSDTYYENAKKLCSAIRALGATPILSTEHDWNYFYYNLARLAQEQGLMMMSWGAAADRLSKVFAPFWYNSHPSTRTAWLWTNGMKSYLDTLPRPEKSIKLFRVRPGTDTSSLNNLVYDDCYSRAERYEEIGCGVTALSATTEKYFDRLDTNAAQFVDCRDEYQELQSGASAVQFGTHCLIELITPYDRNGLKGATVRVNATGIASIYVKKINNLSNPLPAERYVAFGLQTGNLSRGQTFTITGGVFNDNIKGTYTVMDVVNGMVITTTSSEGKTTSGTDNPTTDINGISLKGSYDYPSAEYMLRYKKPSGEWRQVGISDGEIKLDSLLRDIVDYDKISMLITGSDISLSDVSATVHGAGTKDRLCGKRPMLPQNGVPMLSDSLFTDGSRWAGLDETAVYVPVKANTGNETEPLPAGITTVRVLQSGQTLSQVLETSVMNAPGYGHGRMQVRVVARYFPEYINSDDRWTTSGIKRGSYDCARLAVQTGYSNPVAIGVLHVGLSWHEYILETPYFGNDNIVLSALDNNLQVAKCEVVAI